ncbi:DUF4179 domain-containing protein [Paenibacillus motobuensis]|uniref:DUF4179 domain-containing protein n=1 Tax=Paenibacillus TaxID=44249 RepID=UPI00203E6A9E|nr:MULTISPECIES: DUF4179 domain-containing protein [Paenibacillus]MCM3039595.1 DUF4179 domain-containing protein [Paenibacillus lutimineralis]MCM3646699.1 DUF4179 domain-containing protein [Paenibacillus motobuensis]
MSRERDTDLKAGLEQALEKISVPESLFQFAEELPGKFDRGELALDGNPKIESQPIVSIRSKRRKIPVVFKGTAVVVILVVTFFAGVTISPAFASLVRGVPGIDIAIDWLKHIREQDGVQTAMNHDYIPIDPVTMKIDGTIITISDIYLTEEELLFKSFIQTDAFDITDGSSPVSIWISPIKALAGQGSTTSSSVMTAADSSGKPVLQETYKYQLSDGVVKQFLEQGTELELEVTKRTVTNEGRNLDIQQMGTITVSIQPDKLLHNKVLEPKQALPVGDFDLKELSLEKLTIQPTTMNLILKGPEGWYYEFPRDDETAPYLKDDQGREYRYDPSGSGLLYYEGGKLQLPFSSSVYFEPNVRSLTLHIGSLQVGEFKPSEKLELSLNGEFPRTIHFKNKEIVIEGADYVPEGYLHLKIKKDSPKQKRLEGVSFGIVEEEILRGKLDKEGTEAYDAYRKKQREDMKSFHVNGFGIAEDYRNSDYLNVYIPAPKLDQYTLTLSRTGDSITVNRDYTVSLMP